MKAVRSIPAWLIVGVVFLAFFLMTLAANFSASHDSIHYLNGIVSDSDLFHQHHLLYHVSASYWLKLWQPFFSAVPDYYIIESFTALWGSACLALTYCFFRNRFGLSSFRSVIGVSIIGFSYGFWFYSVNIETYTPPIFFTLTALYILSGDRFSPKDVWKLALAHCMAILFHQASILLAPTILFILFRNRKQISFPKALAQYLLTGILLVGGLYFFIGWVIVGQDSLADWTRWVQGYTVGHGFWQPLSLKTPLYALTGFSRAFIGGHFLFQIPFLKDIFDRSFASHGLNDELFLTANMEGSTAMILAFLAVVLAFLLLLMIIRFIRKYKAISDKHARIVQPLLLCIATYSLFFCFWMPEILEFWILQMGLTWLLLIGTTPLTGFPLRIPVTRGLILAGLIVFSVNFFGSIRWLQHIENDWYYAQAQKIGGAAERGDMILTEDGWIIKDFLRYFTPALVLSPDDPGYSAGEADRAIAAALASNRKVFVYRRPNPNDRFIGGYIDGLLMREAGRKKTVSEKEPEVYVLQ
ncbi:MAG TPA: hypothetical protein PK339_11905 [Flavitalea sp.]|nr:hypothetical protein [Flavitalea sp.]